MAAARKGLYYNINKKRKEGRKMRKKGAKGAPKASDFKRAAQTAKKTIQLPKTPATKGAGRRTKTIKARPKLTVKKKAYARKK